MSLMENLLNLFRVDAQVRGLQSRLESAKRFLAAQQNKLGTVLEQTNELQTRRRQVQAELHNAETEMGALSQRIEKLRAELNAAETNKQYTALLTEINTLKVQRSETETVIIEFMEHVETIAAELHDDEGRAEERTKHRDLAMARFEETTAEVGARLGELEAERDVAANNVPGKELQTFDELGRQYDGEAMSALEIVDRRNREYACSACHMHVPFESTLVLMGSNEAIVLCAACRRILYLQEETRGVLAAKS